MAVLAPRWKFFGSMPGATPGIPPLADGGWLKLPLGVDGVARSGFWEGSGGRSAARRGEVEAPAAPSGAADTPPVVTARARSAPTRRRGRAPDNRRRPIPTSLPFFRSIQLAQMGRS